MRNNVITGNHKGGIGVDSNASNAQVDITIEGNVVTQNGLDPQFAQNSHGVRIYIAPSDGPIGSVRVANNVVAFNGNTNTSGGGIFIIACCAFPSDPPSGVSIEVVNNTVYGNTAGYGGGLAANASDLQLHNNIFFANTATVGSDLSVQGALFAVVNSNVIGDGQFEGINNNISSDPLLVDPAMGNFELAEASPAIDAGDNLPCPSTDLAGQERPVDGNNDATAVCDIGAFEYCPLMPDADGDLAGDACDAPGTGNVDCSPPPIGVTSVDALKVLRHSASLPVTQNEPCLDIGQPRALPPPADWKMGDVDCSGTVNAVDALKILRAVANLSVAKPAECPEIKPPT